MKILYHHRTRATDAQRVHILEIVNAFRGLGHQVVIASLVDTETTPNDARNEAREASWKTFVRRVPFAYELVQLGYNIAALPWLLWKIRRERIDFIYERYSLLNFCGVVAARLSGRPIALEVNSPFALEQRQEGEIRAIRFAGWMERITCNAANRVIVVTGPLARILIQNGVMESKLVIMPNGANPPHLGRTAGSNELRKSLGLEGRIAIGFVGWFRPWHGVEFLIQAFADSDLPRNTALLLIGDGPAMQEIKALVERRRLESRVVFAGPVLHENIPPYLEIIDIAVQPAANHYCCPMKILEYMALAKPIVAPRQENIEELLTDGKEALLFAPGDTAALRQGLQRLAQDAGLRAKLGAGARAAIDERGLQWTRNAERTVELLFGGAATGSANRGHSLGQNPESPVTAVHANGCK
jgi:glycosyltransferase involved in cell wall biosynthesis